MKNVNKKRFTLLKILLIITVIAILVSIIIAINPKKQLADTRNAQRRMDVNTILNAVYQYSIDNDSIPNTITTIDTEICDTTGSDCNNLVDLGILTNSGTYIVDIPHDPNGTCATHGVCYEISKDSNGRVTVTAPDAENGATISVTR